MNDRTNVQRAACIGNGDLSLVILQHCQCKTFHFTETEQKNLLALKDITKQGIKVDSASQKSNRVKKESRKNIETLPGYGGMELRSQISADTATSKKWERQQKDFNRYIISKRKVRDNAVSLLNGAGHLVNTEDTEVLNAFFTSVLIITKVCFQIPQIFVLSNRVWGRKVLPMAEENRLRTA